MHKPLPSVLSRLRLPVIAAPLFIISNPELVIATGWLVPRLLTSAAMLAGLGVELARPVLIQSDLQSGALVQVSDVGLDDGQDYYLCIREDRDVPPDVRRVAAWLEADVGFGVA